MHGIAKFASALAVVASASTAVPKIAQAQDTPAPDPLVICDYLVSEGFFRNFGQCVSGFRVGDAAFCRQLDQFTLELLGYRNRGDCVASLRQQPNR